MTWSAFRRICWVIFPVSFCVFVGCGSSAPTRLCEGFQSYQTVEEIRKELSRRGIAAEWKERTQGAGPADPRPPYQFIEMSGPFRLSGVDGQLRLTFYNGHLMETQFTPRKGQDYLAALRAQGLNVPQNAGVEIVTDLRTRFRFDSDADGTTFFTWYDPKLQGEWKKWVEKNA